MNNKILVLGASGMAGHVIYRYLKSSNKYNMKSHCWRNPVSDDSIILDLYKDSYQLIDLIRKEDYDVIINAVGKLHLDSDRDKNEALFINGAMPHIISKSCRRLIHISTDCVFDGEDGGSLRDENSHKSASCVYGITKSLGEVDNDKDCTIRTSIVGPEIKNSGTGLFHWFSKQSGVVSGWSNAMWNGITTLELARIIETAIGNEGVFKGVFSPTSSEPVSKYELLNMFNSQMGSDVVIEETYLPNRIDRTMSSVRDDIEYRKKPVEQMVNELVDWYY